MNRSVVPSLAGALAMAALSALAFNVGAQQSAPAAEARPAPAAAAAPEYVALGDDRFRIGRIVVDKRAKSFVVPGRTNVLDQGLEYLATTPGGMKAYETLLELDATGSEFNLACILAGLEADPNLKPFSKGSSAPITGPRVTLTLSWTADGKRSEMSAAEAIGVKPGADGAPVEWAYTGSPMSQAARFFVADRTGTLIGFVHDSATIIEAVVPIGIGAYGSIRGNPALPPKGSAIELTVAAQTPRR